MFLKLAKVKIAVIFFDLIYWEFVWITSLSTTVLCQ